MNQVVPLHVHSEYSLLDGAIRVSDLVNFAKEKGAPVPERNCPAPHSGDPRVKPYPLPPLSRASRGSAAVCTSPRGKSPRGKSQAEKVVKSFRV